MNLLFRENTKECIDFITSLPDDLDFRHIVETFYDIKTPFIYQKQQKDFYSVIAFQFFLHGDSYWVSQNIDEIFEPTLAYIEQVAREPDQDFEQEIKGKTNLYSDKKGLSRKAKPTGELKIFKNIHTKKWEAWIGEDMAANSPSVKYIILKLAGYGYTATEENFVE